MPAAGFTQRATIDPELHEIHVLSVSITLFLYFLSFLSLKKCKRNALFSCCMLKLYILIYNVKMVKNIQTIPVKSKIVKRQLISLLLYFAICRKLILLLLQEQDVAIPKFIFNNNNNNNVVFIKHLTKPQSALQ